MIHASLRVSRGVHVAVPWTPRGMTLSRQAVLRPHMERLLELLAYHDFPRCLAIGESRGMVFLIGEGRQVQIEVYDGGHIGILFEDEDQGRTLLLEADVTVEADWDRIRYAAELASDYLQGYCLPPEYYLRLLGTMTRP